jgi:hypothetical protein
MYPIIQPASYHAPLAEVTASDLVAGSAGAIVAGLAIRGLAGYFVGNLLGYPVAGVVATAALGLPGLLGVAIYSKHGGK